MPGFEREGLVFLPSLALRAGVWVFEDRTFLDCDWTIIVSSLPFILVPAFAVRLCDLGGGQTAPNVALWKAFLRLSGASFESLNS